MPQPVLNGDKMNASKASKRTKFHIFGNGISFSISPTIHNAAFRYHGLPYVYDIQESQDISGVADLIGDHDFGGASVTMPHKLEAFRFCDEKTETAERIGAINTLIVTDRRDKRIIIGDNTDWSGLFTLIKSYMRRSGKTPNTGLVIGAGGASRAAIYALYRVGVQKVYLVNRTRATANAVRETFRDIMEITVLTSLEELLDTADVVIGTVPANTTSEDQFHNIFRNEGLCIDMSYKPRQTPLLAVARRHPGWEIVTGLEVLLAQAFDQYQLWTGKEPPRRAILEALAKREHDIGLLELEGKF